MNKTIKCPYCEKIFFTLDNNDNKCPFCGKELTNLLDFLKDIFN